MKNNTGNNIKHRRENLHLSEAYMAKALSISLSEYRAMEAVKSPYEFQTLPLFKKHGTTPDAVLWKLSEIFGSKPDVILHGRQHYRDTKNKRKHFSSLLQNLDPQDRDTILSMIQNRKDD